MGSPPAVVELQWRAFRAGGKAYVKSAVLSVNRSSDGLRLFGVTARSRGFPTMPDGPEGTVQSVEITVEWERRSLTRSTSSTKSVELRADGTWQ